MTAVGAAVGAGRSPSSGSDAAVPGPWRAAASRFWRILWVELRTSPALLPMTLLTLIGAFQLGVSDVQWAGYWQDMTLAVHKYTSIVIGTIAGAVASWQVSRSRTTGLYLMENTGRVDGARIVARSVGAIWVLALSAFVILLAVASLRSVTVYVGSPAWGLVVMTLALLGMQVALGAAIGSRLPRGVAPVVTMVVLYAGGVAPVYVTDGEQSWGRLYPILQQYWDTQLRENVPRLLVASLWLVAVSVLLLLVAGRRWAAVRPSGRSLAVSASVAAVTAALVLVPQEQFTDLRGAGEPVACTTGPGPAYCAWADHADTLPPMAEASAVFARATEGLAFTPKTVAAPGVSRALGRPALEVADFVTPVPSRSEALAALVQVTAPMPGPGCVGPDGMGLAPSEVAMAIPALISERVGVPPELGAESSALPALKRLSRAQQDSWMNAAAAAEIGCQAPPPVPTP